MLVHGYDFFAPYRFTASNISYERTMTHGRHAGQEGGWSTMVLPFAATSVTADGVPIDWMHSKNDPKGLWICNFDKEEDSVDEAKLQAEYVGETLEANVPYFVAPYDGANGTDMRGKTYVFSASNVTVKPNPTAITSGTYHMVIGDFYNKNVENAYFLNEAGSYFEMGEIGPVDAFEAYAANVGQSDATRFQIVLDEIAEDAPAYALGDVNHDGYVNVTDVTMLLSAILNDDYSRIFTDNADMNGDGEINVTDVTLLISLALAS